jgi:hypothetical protein
MIRDQPRFPVRVDFRFFASITHTHDSGRPAPGSPMTRMSLRRREMLSVIGRTTTSWAGASYMPRSEACQHACQQLGQPPGEWTILNQDHDSEPHMTVCTGAHTILFCDEGPLGSSYSENNVPSTQSHGQDRVKAGAGRMHVPQRCLPTS